MSLIPVKEYASLSAEAIDAIIERASLNPAEIISNLVKPMAAEFKKDGLGTLKKYSLKFDKAFCQPAVLEKSHLKAAIDRVHQENSEAIGAFEKAIDNITTFHKGQVLEGFETEIDDNTLGLKYVPFDACALYVPGGKALYPTTVMMGIIPARLAGVGDITIISPPNAELGAVPDVVQAIASLAGADRLLQAGGAQSILAAALGVEELNIKPADFIYGPGNIYVAAAKAYVSSQGFCGIDSFAGPSEVVIIADETADPYLLAHDLLAQAEHDEDATSILLCTDEKTCQGTAEAISAAIDERDSDRKDITRESIKRNGHILQVDSLETAIGFSNRFAPEHLEIQTQKDDWILEQIKAAGSVFVGRYAPVAIGDYYSGTNHILPTNGAARFASGVGVQSFYRRITYQRCTVQGIKNSADPITIMSKIEGLFDEHGYSVLARIKR